MESTFLGTPGARDRESMIHFGTLLSICQSYDGNNHWVININLSQQLTN